MKILYDSQCFDMQKSGGISRYFCEIMKNLPTNYSFELSTSYSNNSYLIENEIIHLYNNEIKKKYDNFFLNFEFPGKSRIIKLRNNLFFSDFKTNRELDIEALKEQNFDVFHPTYYDPYFLDYLGNKPFVLTIHDMIHEKYPEMLRDINTIKNKKLLALKAAHIIAISEQTKNDIKDILGIPESKISVIYHGTTQNELIHTENINTYGTYLLFTGTRTNYKNFNFMLLALSEWLKNHQNVKLICTSSDFSLYEKNFISELGLENQVFHVFFNSDNQMYNLYKNALAFIFPSYYEGFGIPILEAFEAQCPIILSNASCFKEIAKDAALYFEPKSKTQLIRAVDSLFNNLSLRQDLIQRGNNRLIDFSWKKAAEQTGNIYDMIA